MKKIILPLLIASLSFTAGYFFNQIFKKQETNQVKQNNIPVPNNDIVQGIAGVFFKSNHPKELKAWYEKNLGMKMNEYGKRFEWYEGNDTVMRGSMQWSVFSAKTTYFNPSQKPYMINYRVNDLSKLYSDLKKAGVTIVDTLQEFEYGKFLHVLDPDSNNLELYEPNYNFKLPN